MFVVTLMLFATNNVTPEIYGEYTFNWKVTFNPH